MKRKSFYLMSAALLGALVITSCGQPERAPDLIYRTWDTGTKAQNNEERQLVRAFEKKENVKIKIIETPGQGDAVDLHRREVVAFRRRAKLQLDIAQLGVYGLGGGYRVHRIRVSGRHHDKRVAGHRDGAADVVGNVQRCLEVGVGAGAQLVAEVAG